jgi:DNA-binding response OmpR family regulator
MSKLLVVEDDQALALELADALGSESHLIDVAHSAQDARAYFRLAEYDLVILDWELPDSSGLDVCHEIRKSAALQMPVLFLTARANMSDKLQGFSSGADDYLTKPFNMLELKARVNALLKRPPAMQTKQLKVRDIVLDREKHEVYQDGQKVELFPKEYALLEFFATHPNQIFTADSLLQRLWSTDSESSPDTVRVTLMRMRQKLSQPEGKPLIVTLRHIGYRLEP